MAEVMGWHYEYESLSQPLVSPAVLQANETGALVRVLHDGKAHLVRTRRVTALGFEPMMKWSEMNDEREALLQWALKFPPRRRNKTLSVPGIDHFGPQFGLGQGNTGVYNDFNDLESGLRTARRAAVLTAVF